VRCGSRLSNHFCEWYLRFCLNGLASHLSCRCLVPPLRCSFCHPCIARWSEIENSCPFCKQRFKRLRRKRLAPRAVLLAGGGLGPDSELPGVYEDSQDVEERNQVQIWCRAAGHGGVRLLKTPTVPLRLPLPHRLFDLPGLPTAAACGV
jgi:hypothetical protein